MQIRSLKIYCDIVQLHGFSKAACENGISQSTASNLVHHLESRLGARLIDRSKRPFVLTPEGERYYDGCRDIVRRYEDLERDVRTLHEAVASRLTIASIYSVGLAHMSQYLREFQARYPKADVRVEYVHPECVYEAIEAEEADLGLISFPERSKKTNTITWRDERMALIVPPTHRLAKRIEAPLDAIEGETVVAFQRGLRIREVIDRELSQRKIDVVAGCEFDNVETIKRAVEIGEGIAIVPKPTVAREVAAGTLVDIRIADCDLVRPIGLIHRRNRKLSETAQRFVDLLLSHGDEPPEAPLDSRSEKTKARTRSAPAKRTSSVA